MVKVYFNHKHNDYAFCENILFFMNKSKISVPYIPKYRNAAARAFIGCEDVVIRELSNGEWIIEVENHQNTNGNYAFVSSFYPVKLASQKKSVIVDKVDDLQDDFQFFKTKVFLLNSDEGDILAALITRRTRILFARGDKVHITKDVELTATFQGIKRAFPMLKFDYQLTGGHTLGFSIETLAGQRIDPYLHQITYYPEEKSFTIEQLEE